MAQWIARPRLGDATPRTPPNVAVVWGYPWYYSEAEAFRDFSLFGVPKTVRMYEDPTNGSSRGIVFVEYDNPIALAELKMKLSTCGQFPLVVKVFHLAALRWDRSGRLPELPNDELSNARLPEGFGPQGFAIRGVSLGLPNTVSEAAMVELTRFRKRIREADEES